MTLETTACQSAKLEDTLEQLVDKYGMSKLLFALASVCHDKAEHLASNWQDTTSAREWTKDATAIEKLGAKIRTI